MQDEKSAFLDKVCGAVRWKQAHQVIRKDLSDHIEDQAAAYEAEGIPPEEAIAKAVIEMGDPDEVGLGLDASYRPRDVLGAALPIAGLILLGLVIRVFIVPVPIDAKYIAAVILGGGCGLLLYNLNLYRFARYAPGVILGVFAAALSAHMTYVFSRESWINGASTFYLYYHVCLFPALYAGLVYAWRGKGMKGLLLCGAAAAAHCLLLAMQPAFGGIFCMVAALLAVLLTAIAMGAFGGRRLLYAAVTLGGTLAGGWFFIRQAPHRYYRFLAMINPGRDPMNTGFLGTAIREAVADARLLGPAPSFLAGNTAFYHYYDMFNDYLITTILYRYGWIPALLVLSALALFLCIGFRRALRLGSTLGKLLGCGAMAGFAAQALGYVLQNFGVIIGAALPLPFLSHGNTALAVNLAMAGLLLSLFRSDGLYSDTPPGKGKKLRIKLEWE